MPNLAASDGHVGAAMTNRGALRTLAIVTAVLALVAAPGHGARAAGGPSPWRVGFSGVRGVHPGMTTAAVMKQWHVRFRFTTGSAPGCKIGSFTSGVVAGGALFQDGIFNAVWFDRGVSTADGVRVGSTVSQLRRAYGPRLRMQRNIFDRSLPLYYVRSERKPHVFLEFFPKRGGLIKSIGFGNRFVFAQEGCN